MHTHHLLQQQDLTIEPQAAIKEAETCTHLIVIPTQFPQFPIVIQHHQPINNLLQPLLAHLAKVAISTVHTEEPLLVELLIPHLHHHLFPEIHHTEVIEVIGEETLCPM
jgi:hypothetical protein